MSALPPAAIPVVSVRSAGPMAVLLSGVAAIVAGSALLIHALSIAIDSLTSCLIIAAAYVVRQSHLVESLPDVLTPALWLVAGFSLSFVGWAAVTRGLDRLIVERRDEAGFDTGAGMESLLSGSGRD